MSGKQVRKAPPKCAWRGFLWFGEARKCQKLSSGAVPADRLSFRTPRFIGDLGIPSRYLRQARRKRSMDHTCPCRDIPTESQTSSHSEAVNRMPARVVLKCMTGVALRGDIYNQSPGFHSPLTSVSSTHLSAVWAISSSVCTG